MHMPLRSFRLPFHLALVLGLGAAGTAAAQASRTWVSGVGDDANPCSRTAPCKTFAGAISKTAAGGEINTMDPGGFGAVTITKSITIDGAGGFGSILAAGTNAIIINAGVGDVVTLRNLSINGIGTGLNGISFLQGAALHLEHVAIFRFSQRGISFQPATNAALYVRNCQISDNNGVAGGGILVKPAAGASVRGSIEDTRLDRNLFGLRVEDRTTVGVVRTVAAGNVNNGFHAQSFGEALSLTLEHSAATGNERFGVHSAGALSIVRISNLTVSGNDQGLSAPSGQIVSLGNNSVIGNNLDGTPTSTVPTI